MEQFGLSEQTIAKIRSVFARYHEIDEVFIYGSRAKGNYNKYSDIDITLKGCCLTKDLLTKIIFDIDDLLLPYEFDISSFDTITNPDVVDHINRVGQLFYKRERTK